MKKIIICGLLLLAHGAMTYAQDYAPTTTWPYVFRDFTEGELLTPGGTQKSGTYNISLVSGKLHFIDGELVKEALASEVFSVRIGSDIYANVKGRMMKVLAKSDNGFVAEDATVDMAALNATGGAYGSSSNSVSTTAFSSLEGVGGTMSNMNHMQLKNSKDEGKILPLNRKLYLVLPDMVVFAAKKDVLAVDGIDKAAMNAFLKENRTKWKSPESLLPVVDRLSELKK